MIETALRGAFILMVVYIAFRVARDIRNGVLFIEEDEPRWILKRREQPVAFWSFVVFFYIVLAVIGGATAFAPSS